MKWIERLREKVHSANLPVSPRANRPYPEEGASPRFGDTNESEQDFKRAWDDFRSAAEKEKEEALEKVLSLFCKISRRTGNPTRLALTLVDSRAFAFAVAKALVTDIEKLRRTSPNGQLQPNDILSYFAGELKGDLCVGGNLLFAIEGLVLPPLDVQPLLEAGLLSSLVIVLYRLLYSADSASSVFADDTIGMTRVADGDDENRRVVVEGSVVHIMKALARHPGAAHTLTECDRFQYMFHMVVMGGTTPLLSPSKKREVRSAPPVHLAQLYRHVLQILELLLASDNGATAQYIKNQELIEELLTPVVYFVRDTGDASYTVSVVSLIKNAVQLSCRPEAGGICLKDNLKKGHGYDYFVQLGLKLAEPGHDVPIGNQISGSEVIPPQLIRLLDIIGELAQIGIRTNGVHPGSGIAGKAGKPPSGGQLNSKSESSWSVARQLSLDGKLRDSDSVQVFQDLFLKTEIVALRVELLDRLLRLFASHPDNYDIVQKLRTMPLFIQNMAKYPPLLQERVLKVLEYTVISANCVPEQELLSLCYLVQQPMASSLRVAVLTFFEKLLSFDRQYKKVLREAGVMDLLVDDLKKCEPPVSSALISSRSGSNPSQANSVDISQLEECPSSPNHLIFEDEATLGLAWSCLISLLRKSEGNQMMFRKLKGVAAVLPLLAAPNHRSNVLKLLSCLIGEDLSQAHRDELKALIDAIHTSSVKNLEGRQWRIELETKEDVLWTMWKVLGVNPALKISFGDGHGFALLLSVLESIQADDNSGSTNLLSSLEELEEDSGEGSHSLRRKNLQKELFSALLHVVIAAVAETPVNRNLLHESLASQNFKRLLHCSGLICRDFEDKFAELLFDLALERVHSPSQNTQGLPILLQQDKAGHDYFQLPGVHGYFVLDLNQVLEGEEIYNASAIEVLLGCLLQFSSKLQLRVLILLKSIANSCPRNQDALCAVGCVGVLLEAIRIMLPNPSSLLTCSLQIVELLGSFRLSSSEIRTLGRYIWQNRDGSGGQTGKSILETVKRMWSIDFVPESVSLSSFTEFRMSRSGHACIRVPLVDRTWPPAAGYSFACWIRLENFRSQALMGAEPSVPRSNLSARKPGNTGPILRIFSVCTAEEKSTTCVELYVDGSGGLKLITSPTSFLSFKGVHLEEERWYHLVVVHNKPNALAGLFQSSVAYLYLNGQLCHTGKLGYATTPIGKPLQVIIGTAPAQAEKCSLSWRLGSCYLYEEVLTAPAVFFMFVMGRAYRGLFQDPNMIRFIPQEACGGGNLAILETLDIEQQSSSIVQRGEGSVRAAAGMLKTEGNGIVWDMEKFANIAQLSGRKLIFAFDGTFSNVSISTAAVTMVNLVDSISASASLSGGIPRAAEISGDVHICTPSNIADNLRKVGGVAVVLAMVEAAKSSEMLHLALSLLHSVLKYNPRNARAMQRCYGYHLLALFLHHRMNFFDKQCLDLLFKIATCQAAAPAKSLPGTEKPAQLHQATSLQDPVRQISGVPDSITRLVHVDSGIDSGFDVSSNPSKFDDQGSSYGSVFDPAESFGQESSTGPGISDLGVSDTSADDDDSDLLSNPDMVAHVLLDWTLWSTASVTTQLAVMGFIGRLVSMKRYRKYNMTVLRRLNLMQHLLVILQRDVQIPVFEAVVELVSLILKDGFIVGELQLVADFVVMTFDPSPSVEGTPVVTREPISNQVKVRNMLLDKMIDLQYFLKSDEVKTEEWNKIVSSKVINYLLDDAVHHHTMGRVVTLLGLCLSSSATFATKFKTTGGYHLLARVLPSFFDSPDIYFILFKLLFNQSVYPRQPEVRMIDFHALMPADGKFGDISFPELLEVVIAMSKAAFNRVSKQSLSAQQSGNFSEFSASLSRSFSDVTEDSGEGLQGEALLHKTYAAILMGGEASAPALITSILRFMVDLAKMCHPFTLACKRMEFLESVVDLYFACARSAGAVQSAQEALAHSLQSEQEEDLIYPDDSLPTLENEVGYQKVNGLSDPEVKLQKSFSGELLSSAFPEYPMDTIHNIFLDSTVEVAGSLPKYDEHALRPSSPSIAGLESSPRWGQGESPTASEVSSSVVTPKVENVGSPVGSFIGAPHEAFSRLRALSSLAGKSEGDSSSRYKSSAFFSSTPRSEVDSLYSDFGAASSGRFTPRENPDAIVTPKLLLQLESLRSSSSSCATGAAAILDLVAEVLADTLTEQVKGMALVEAAIEAVPLYVGSDTMLVFQGLCLGRMVNFLERRLVRDEEEHPKKLDKNRWAPNLDTLSWLLVDRAFMGAFADTGSPIKVLEFLLAMLQLANSDGRVEEAVPAGKGLMALARGGGRQVEPYVQALLKNTNRMVMFCLLPTSSAGLPGEDSLTMSFRRSSDSLLRSLDSLRHNAEGGPDAFGLCTQEVDKATVLQLILANKKLIFCASNVDPELLCALCVNVTPLLWDREPSTRSLAVDVWRALVLHRSPSLEDILIWRGTQGAMNMDVLHNGFNLLLTVGFKDFYAWIEDSWDMVREVLEQRAAIVWKEYVQGASRFPAVRIKPLEGRRKMQMTRRLREITKIDHSHRELVSKSRYGLEQVRESIAAELRTLRQNKYGWILHAEREWEKQIQQLVHERGLWPVVSATADGKPFWQLSTKEGPFRMRKKLERPKRNQSDIYDTNLEGDDTPGLEYGRRESLGREATPPSLSADHPEFKIPHLRVHSKDFFLSLDEEDDQSKNEGVDDDDASSAQGQWTDHPPSSSSVIQENQVHDNARSGEDSRADGREDPDSAHDTEENRPIGDAQSMEIDVNEDGEYLIRPFLEPGEKLKFRYNCERVIGLDKRDGIFLIGEQCLYAIDNYYIDEEGCIKEKGDEGDISVIDRALGVPIGVPMAGSNDSQDGNKQSSGSVGETVPASWPGGRAWAFSGGAWGKDKVRAGPTMRHTWHKWKLDSVHELLKRQYQLRPVAIELFSMDGCNELLIFLKNERDEAFKNLLAQNLPRNSMLDTTISGASKQEGNEGGRLFKMLAKSFSKRWQNGEISNFQYLMHLNTLAGRGYNDLTQYPVFPWILADYESQELDLTKPETFRCLEKPMGAHHPAREEAFKTRYENWEDPDIPRFHYGSHYSSAGIVLFYLIRLPPFSWENKKLQGGDFDHADRLFSSFQDTWHSATQGNTADVKELIPEFFYLPEFLENRFDFDLGVKQSGEKVDHVELPPWAKGSAREFIRKHREALECQYVSENLHHWIDLIFGFKQRGKAAVEATNVFYHLTYDGAVNIDSVPDPAMKAAILAQINHFGQTPRQLFAKPHPKRRWVPRPTLSLVPYSYHTVVPQEIRTMASRVSQILFYLNTPYIATSNRVLRPPSYDKYAAWGFPDRSLRFMSYDQDRVLSTHENLHDDGPVTCAGFSRDGQILVTGGEDGVVSVWRFAPPMSNNSPLQLQQALCAHTQAVTCLAVSQSYSLVVSASKDRTVIFWDLTSLEYVRQLPELRAPATALHINDMSGEVVTAVGVILTVWSINGDCLAAVNTSHAYPDTILSITSPQVPDWTEAGWYLTGHQSGEIRMWRMLFDSHSSTNRMSLLRTQSGSDPFTTPAKPGSKLRASLIALPPGSGLRRLKSGVESIDDPTKPKCITGGTPEFQLLLIKVLSFHKDPVTALSLSHDLKQLCSGDSGGHVVSWTLLDDASKNPPLLGSLSQLDICNSCHSHVMTSERSLQYCSNCGQVLCSKCSEVHKIPLEDLGHFLPVRVCTRCFQARKTTTTPPPVVAEDEEEPTNEAAAAAAAEVGGTLEPYLSNSSSFNRSGRNKF